MKKIFRILLLSLTVGISILALEIYLKKPDVHAERVIQVSESTQMEEYNNVENVKQNGKLDLVRTSPVPLFVQTDDEWKDLPYGTDGNQDMGENGCALAVLAMVGNYHGFGSTPKTLLEWAQEDYYVDGAGTSWDIFADYAALHELNFLNLGNNMQGAIEELEQGHLVVVSVKKSQFTEVGHIMLLTGYENGQFSLNDPNDDETKLHNYKWIDASAIEEASVNYWSYY